MTQPANPLRAFFRQPAIYIRLPSDGQFWPDGSLEIPPNKEIPVLPMTAIDEITYRTPDALFNGAATVNVIQSCIPSIKNAWVMPQIDLNTVLTAIRIASYGKKMELNSTCPECSAENDFELDLQDVMSQLASPDFSSTVKHGDLEIFFRPMNYQHQTDINLLQFEQQRILQQLPTAEMSEEEKNKMLNAAIQEITLITVKAIMNSIGGIKTPAAFVSEPEHIEDFLRNCDRQLYAQIRDKAIELRGADEFKPANVECPDCHHKYEQKFSLDSASFFANAS